MKAEAIIKIIELCLPLLEQFGEQLLPLIEKMLVMLHASQSQGQEAPSPSK